MNERKASLGRIVHYRFQDSRTIGGEPKDERPAIIVRVWPGPGEHGGTVQLQVFLDTDREGCHNDGGGRGALEWQTSVAHGPDAGQWHWSDECPAAG